MLPIRSIFRFLVPLLIFFISTAGAQTREIWGTTQDGGEHNLGCIFKTDANGDNYQVVYSFKTESGEHPWASLLEASDGFLYGMTATGGLNNEGVIFRYHPVSKNFQKVFDFDAGTSGGLSFGSLMEASNGKLYGIGRRGGTNGDGTLFELDPATLTVSILANFSEATTGKYPTGRLLQASDGKIYGLTNRGGSYGDGVLFQFDINSQTLVKKADFNGPVSGRLTSSSLIEGSNGLLYSANAYGGTHDQGVLFSYDLNSGNISVLHHFDGTSTGDRPSGAPLFINGKVVGFTELGGAFNEGSAYSYDPATSTLINITSYDSPRASFPSGSPVLAANGTVYGLGRGGGSNNVGSIFTFDPVNGTSNRVNDFDLSLSGGEPYGSLISASNGLMYGLASEGGEFNSGTLFSYDPVSNTLWLLHSFGSAINGTNPTSGLTMYRDGMLYGMTSQGGTTNDGVIFRIDPLTGSFTKLFDFERNVNGGGPMGSFYIASNGALYGVAENGPNTQGGGMLFRFHPPTEQYPSVNYIDVIHEFTATNITGGVFPFGGVIEGEPGKLYGTALKGGANGDGILYSIDFYGRYFTVLADFDEATTGASSRHPLLKAKNGKIYGISEEGGTSDAGTIFSYDPVTATLSTEFNFNGNSTGKTPVTSLVQGFDGSLYGTSLRGGSHDQGILYRFNPANGSFQVKHNFSYAGLGNNARCELLIASDGMIYGATRGGGQYDLGKIYRYDPFTNSTASKITFNGTNGAHPGPGHMAEAFLAEFCEPFDIDHLTLVNAADATDVRILNEIDTIDINSLPHFTIRADACGGNYGEPECINFEGFIAGHNPHLLFSDNMIGPIILSAENSVIPEINAAMIFNTTMVTGGDADLGTPHSDFGGPGSGTGGATGSIFANDTPRGNVLIISEDLDQLDPDDSRHPGIMNFNFEYIGDVTMHSITLIDVDPDEQPPVVRFYDALRVLLDTVALSATGDNGVGIFDLGGISGVESMEIEFFGSAAVDDICFTRDNFSSVLFKVNDAVYSVENIAPFTLAGDNKTRYNAWDPAPGTYLVTARPYELKNAKGFHKGGIKSTLLTVIDSVVYDCNGDPGGTARLDSCGTCVEGNTGKIACEDCDWLEVTSYSVVDATTGAEIGPLADGDTLYKGSLGPFSIRANVCHNPVTSVWFYLNGSLVTKENLIPYDINGGTQTVPYPWSAPTGTHSLVALPRSGRGMYAQIGQADTIGFTVVAGVSPRSTNENDAPFEISSRSAMDLRSNRLSSAVNLTIYPNPTKGELNLHLSGFADVSTQISLLDLTGRMLLKADVHPESELFEYRMNLDDLPAGIYLLSISAQGRQVHQQVVKR